MSVVAAGARSASWGPSWVQPVVPSAVVAVLVLVNFVYRLVASRPGYFWQDDYYIAAWAKYTPLGPDFLFLRFSDHFQPLGLAFAWVSQRAFPGSYPAAMTWTALLYALSIWAMYRLLLALFGWRPQMMLVLLFYGFSVFTLQSYLWYAASIYLAPYLLLLPLGLLVAIRYIRRPRPVMLLLAFVSSLLVIAAHTFGASLVALTALLLAVGAVGPDTSMSWWKRVSRQWRLLLVQAAPVLALLVYYASRSASGKGVTVEPLQSLEYVAKQFAWVIIPGMAGGPWKYNTFLGPEFPFFTPLAGFVIVEFIIALVALAWIRKRAFWFWVAALSLIAVQLAAVTLGRGGGDTATILRYSTPGLVALTLAIALTLMSPTDGDFTWSRWGQGIARKWRSWDVLSRLLVVVLLMQAFLVSFSVSALTPIFETPFGFNRTYMANLTTAATQVPDGLSLIPQFVPNAVVPVAAPGPTSTQLVLASQESLPTFVDSVEGEIWGFAGDGRLVKQAVFGAEVVGARGSECVALLTTEAQTVRLKKQSESDFGTLSLGTIAEDASAVRVELLSRGEVASSVELGIDSGLRRTYGLLSGQGDSLRITPLDGRPVCVTDAVLGERFHWDGGWVQDGSSLPTQTFDLTKE